MTHEFIFRIIGMIIFGLLGWEAGTLLGGRVDTEFVRFPEEFHGLSRSGRTDRRIARLKHILRWFDKYLK